MNEEKNKFFKLLRLAETQLKHSKDISHIFDDYDNMNNNPSESKLVPNCGSCTGIDDEDEIIGKIQKIIDERIIPEGIITIEKYLLQLKTIFTKSLILEKSALAMQINDGFVVQNIIITERIIIWLDKQISITNDSPNNSKINKTIKRIIDKCVLETYDKAGNVFIDKKIAESFKNLLLGIPKTQNIKWQDSDWKLYFIIEHLVNLQLLKIPEVKIVEYILINFTFPNKKVSKSNLNYSVKRAKSLYIKSDFVTKLSGIITD